MPPKAFISRQNDIRFAANWSSPRSHAMSLMKRFGRAGSRFRGTWEDIEIGE